MPDEFKYIKEHAQELETQNSARNAMYKEMENLYWMRWDEEAKLRSQVENLKITRTPRARTAIQGAKRLLIATDPQFGVPYDINRPDAMEQAGRIEKFLKAIWFAAGRIAGNPLHYDVVLSALLYSDIIIGINSTRDLLENATGSKAYKKRLEEIHARTPFLPEVYNPMSCYTERDIIGLKTFYRKTLTTAGDIMDRWGAKGIAALNSNKGRKMPERAHQVTLCDWYDLSMRYIWLDGFKTPIVEDEHNLPMIPVATSVAEGSNLFSKPEEQREPFLYTVWKSGMIDRQNLILTEFYTLLFAMGANPMFVDYTTDPDHAPVADYSVPGGTMHYRLGEHREVMTKQIVDPAMMQAWEIANDLEQQATIFRTTLGEPVSASTPYSSLALLSQSGRLPLVATQRLAGQVIGEAGEIIMKWVKDEGGEAKAQYDKVETKVSAGEIPEVIDVEVKLEISLPIDRLQMANAANMLAQGERPIVSKRWARENVLNIGQSEDMTKEIWEETNAELFHQRNVFEQMAIIAQMKQMAMQPAMSKASGMPGSESMPGFVGPGGAMPPSPAMGAQEGQTPPNYGTPPQPIAPPGPAFAEPVEPVPPLAPNLQPLRGKR